MMCLQLQVSVAQTPLSQSILMGTRQVLIESARGAQRLVCSTDTPDHQDLIWSAECDGRNTRPGLLHQLPRSWLSTELVCRLPESTKRQSRGAQRLVCSTDTPVKNETVFERHITVAGSLRAPGRTYYSYTPRVRRGSRGERKG